MYVNTGIDNQNDYGEVNNSQLSGRRRNQQIRQNIIYRRGGQDQQRRQSRIYRRGQYRQRQPNRIYQREQNQQRRQRQPNRMYQRGQNQRKQDNQDTLDRNKNLSQPQDRNILVNEFFNGFIQR